jgi:hypothetical protein
VDKIDDAKREAMAARLRESIAVQELEAMVASLRGKVGVKMRKDAVEKKKDS